MVQRNLKSDKKLHVQGEWVYWMLNVTLNGILAIYVTAHRCRSYQCDANFKDITFAVWPYIISAPDWSSKIEKVPRGIRGEKSSKDMASSRNLVSTIGALASPKWGTEPGVQKGKRSLLASYTRCICSMETTHNSVKFKLGIKVMKLVERVIVREVTVGQGSECHLTFVRGLPYCSTRCPYRP